MQSLPRVFPTPGSSILFLCQEVPTSGYIRHLASFSEAGYGLIAGDKAAAFLLEHGIKNVASLSEAHSSLVSQLELESQMFPEPISVALTMDDTTAGVGRLKAKSLPIISLVVIDTTAAGEMRDRLKAVTHPTMDDVRRALPLNLLNIIPRAVAKGRTVVTSTEHLAKTAKWALEGVYTDFEESSAFQDICNARSLHFLRTVGDAVDSALLRVASSAAAKLKSGTPEVAVVV